MAKLGILVMGQSPRPEVEAELRRLLPGVELDLRGCLDGMREDEIAGIAPQGGESALFTRLPSGRGCVMLC